MKYNQGHYFMHLRPLPLPQFPIWDLLTTSYRVVALFFHMVPKFTKAETIGQKSTLLLFWRSLRSQPP